MYKWTICAFMLLGCSTQSGEASKPDEGDLNTFDDYSRWGAGMAGFTAPPSNQVAGGGGGSGVDGVADDEDTGGEASEVTADGDGSCWFGEDICIEANEPDNVSWCLDQEGTYVEDWCSDGEDGTCELPTGGDYSAGATAYFYGGFDGESACESAGGSYSGS